MEMKPFQLERYFASYEFNVPYLLCSSDGESFTVQEILDLEPGSQEALNKVWLGHTQSRGSESLRQAIASLYTHTDSNQILVHSGAEEAIFICMNALLKPGDHVIVHYPRYQSLSEVAKAIGCDVTFWEADPENNWELDIAFLEKSIRKSTKLIVINCPHNPTGYLMSQEKFQAVINVAQANHLYLFSDEVYRYLEHDSSKRLPNASDLYEKAISLGVMSKTFSLAGLRIGWIATHDAYLYQKMASFKDYTTRSNSAPSEFLAEIALRHYAQVAERTQSLVKSNLKILNEFFIQYQDFFDWKAPQAGSIAFPRLKLSFSAEEFCKDLREKAGVLLMPGNCFGEYKDRFRIGFGHKSMREALHQFDRYLQKYLSDDCHCSSECSWLTSS